MYKENHSPPNQHPSPPHTLSLVSKVATVDCFPLTARIDELLLTETCGRYWSVDKTLQITEKTLPRCLLRHAASTVCCATIWYPMEMPTLKNMSLFNM